MTFAFCSTYYLSYALYMNISSLYRGPKQSVFYEQYIVPYILVHEIFLIIGLTNVKLISRTL